MHRSLFMGYLCLGFALSATSSGGTWWQHDPATPGDWFDPANWSAGVPGPDDYAYIDNAGTAHIGTGIAEADRLYLGYTSTGSGTIRLTGGELESGCSQYVGYYRTGLFIHTGGSNTITGSLALGYQKDSSGIYQLSGEGELSANWEAIGDAGTGRFVQAGGTNMVEGPLYLGYRDFHAQGTYELSSGELWAGGEYIGDYGSGLFKQTGGSNTTGYLSVKDNSRYELSGGTLRITDGLDLRGTLDFAGGAPAVSVGDSVLLDLSRGTILGAGDAALSVGANSLTIYAPALDPADVFGDFTTQGITHQAGQTLVVTADQGFGGRGEIYDHVDCAGTIAAHAGYGIDLNAGLNVSGSGSVELGSGTLTIRNTLSGITGNGSLRADSETVGSSGTGRFAQSGGTNAVKGELTLYGVGTYELSGDGHLSAASEEIAGRFIQTGGTNAVTGSVRLGEKEKWSGTYELNGDGLLSARRLIIGGWGTGQFTQTGGTVTIDDWMHLGHIRGSRGTYTLSGGELAGREEYVGYRGTGLFSQTGGTNTAGYLCVGPSGRYEFAGGTLQITGGMTLAGEWDCAGGTPTISAGDATWIDLSRGSVLNAGEATLTVGADSLTIYAPGAHPSDLFGSFNTPGMLHQAGQTLVVAPGQKLGGWGDIDDHVECAGSIVATPGGGINFSGGLRLSGSGYVNMGSGDLIVDDLASGISEIGHLRAYCQYVGYSGTGHFTHTAGTNKISEDLYLGYHEGSCGTYELSGGGLWLGGMVSQQTVGRRGTGIFRQTGGINALGSSLYIGRFEGSSGVYELSGGELATGYQYVGGEGTGHFTQTGGTNRVWGHIYLGEEEGSSGTYQLGGGQLESGGNQYAGYEGTGQFAQVGGTNTVGVSLHLGYCPGSQGTYRLSDTGVLTVANRLCVGVQGTGRFEWFGGTLDTPVLALSNNGTLAMGYDFNLSDLLSGRLLANRGTIYGLSDARLEVANGATAVHDTNTLAVRTLRIADTGRYEFIRGAALQLPGGLVADGEFDCAGQTVTINAGQDAWVDLSKGSVQNAGQATLAVGPNSLTIYAPGAHPSDLFGSFGTQGMMHQAGQTLFVGPAEGFGGSGQLDDHVACEGVIAATGPEGIYLNDGVTLSAGGSVDLGPGALTVDHTPSAVSGGSLRARTQYVGYSSTGCCRQSGGTNTATRGLYLGHQAGSSGTYELSGGTNTTVEGLYLGYGEGSRGTYKLSGGELRSEADQYVGYRGTGLFTQAGGTNTIEGELYLGNKQGSSGTYELAGGDLRPRYVHVGRAGGGSFIQTGGANTIKSGLFLGTKEGSSGRYELGGGELQSGYQHIGYEGVGLFIQTTGINLADYVSLGREEGSSGTYELTGGELRTARQYIGTDATGRFIQVGGTNQITEHLYLGLQEGSSGTYELSGGDLSADEEHVGGGGAGLFGQTGGASIVGSLYLGHNQGSSGTYDLGGGQLTAKEEHIAGQGQGVFRQCGGTNAVSYLSVGSAGRYEFTGGTLRITAGFKLAGDLDCAASAVTVNADDSSLVDLSGGSVLNAEQAALAVGANSLTIYAPGSHPSDLFGSFETQGMTHQAGRTLVVPGSKGFGGWGDVDDPVICLGSITASAEGAINLNDGLQVAGHGSVDLGPGQLAVNDAGSGLRGQGSLSAAQQYIGHSTTGSFRQDGGTNTIADKLYLGYQPGSSGTYVLTGGGLRSEGGQRIGYDGAGLFGQTGGTNAVGGDLLVGCNEGSSGTYELSGGELWVDSGQRVGNGGTGRLIHSGGSNSVQRDLSLGQRAGSSGTYELSGDGQLTAQRESVGRSGAGHFIQTGGTNRTWDLELGRDRCSSGTYTISGGSLSVAGLHVAAKGRGTFNITDPAAAIAISELLRFGPASTFTAVPGSTIHMTGAWFDNQSTDPAALAGLGNLTLIFEGGDQYLDDFEVAGADLGPVPAGWVSNFVLGTLQLGGDAGVGRIRLVDNFDNRPVQAEALYVDYLLLDPGAWIDLNGLNLYFLNGGDPKQLFGGDANLDGKVDGLDYNRWSLHYGGSGMGWCEGDFDGSTVVDGLDYNLWSLNYRSGYDGAGAYIPEPAALATILAGGLVLVARRRTCGVCPRSGQRCGRK